MGNSLSIPGETNPHAVIEAPARQGDHVTDGVQGDNQDSDQEDFESIKDDEVSDKGAEATRIIVNGEHRGRPTVDPNFTLSRRTDSLRTIPESSPTREKGEKNRILTLEEVKTPTIAIALGPRWDPAYERTWRMNKINELQSKRDEKKLGRDKLKDEYEGLRSKVLEVEKETTALAREEKEKDKREAENEKDRQWQVKKREDQVLEIEDLERQKRREEALEKAKSDSAEKKKRSRPDQQGLGRFTASVRRGEYQDGHSLETSDAEDTENGDDNYLKSLREIINNVEELENKIREARTLSEKVESVVDERIVLERELDLESRWLATRLNQGVASAFTPESALVHKGQDHFSRSLSDDDLKFYKTLKPGEFRLLVVWPSKADYYPLLCSLETAKWDHNTSIPKYAALSYSWGSDLCNGRLYLVLQDGVTAITERDTWGSTARYAFRIPIRNNLFRALLRLRRADKPVSLWVDVVCINQNNLVEKTEQLEQLIQIYRKAENVCIWLGESDNEGRSDKAMDFITSIMDFAVLDRYAKDSNQAKKWNGLAELMRDRWFSRRWVVQEISLAREATVHCGGKMVQWLDFADAVSLLASNQTAIKKLFDYKEWRDGPNTLGDIQSFGAYILLEATSKLFLRTAEGDITRPVKKLESLVTSLKTFDATEKMDLIYSLVSIASDTPQSRNIYGSKGQTAELKVDYTKEPITVYKDFTRFCIMSSKSLNILCRPWAMPVETAAGKFPSWIPLLSQSEFGTPEEVYSGRKNGENLVGPVDRPHYKAAGEDPERMSKYDINELRDNEQFSNQNILPLKGLRLAKIIKVSPRNTGGVILRESLRMGGWAGLNEDTASVPDRIWRTLVADKDPDGQIPPTWYQRACLRCLEIADTFNNGDLNIGELLQGNSELIRKYLTRMRNITWNRRFFQATMDGDDTNHDNLGVVAGGRVEDEYKQSVKDNAANTQQQNAETMLESERLPLFGLGPPTMQEGDFVCILAGCTVPIILREMPPESLGQEDGHMMFVGEAYVHGKMEGEAVEDFYEHENKTYGKELETFKVE